MSLRYSIKELLGRGHFAAVHLCRDNITGLLHAIKIFEKVKLDDVEAIRNEVKILHALSHPNILAIRDLIKEDNKLFMVFDLAKEGDLFNFILLKKKFTEVETRRLYFQLCSAVQFLVGISFRLKN